jgi:DHA1 family multidrug resistance protein-like MFS transporter
MLSKPLVRLMIVTALYTAIAGAAIPYEAVYVSTRFGLATAVIGGFSTAAGIVALPLQLAGGHLSDRFGRRPLLMAGTIAGALGCLGLALAPVLAIALLSWVVLQFGVALLFPITLAMAADVAREEAHDRAFAWVYAAVGVGWAAGTLPAGLAGFLGYGLLFTVGAVLGALATAAALTIPETRPKALDTGEPLAIPPANVWQDRDFAGLGLLTLGIWLVGGQLLVTLPLWVVNILGYPNAFFGLLMALNGVLIAVGQVALSDSVRRFPTTLVLAAGTLGFGVGYALVALRTIPALVVGTVLFTIGEMLVVPTTSAALERLAPAGRGGQYQGAGAMLQSVGTSAGPLPGGALLQWGGPALWAVCLAWSMLCAAGYAIYGRTSKLGARAL